MQLYQCHKRVKAAKITEIYGRVELESTGKPVINLGFADGSRQEITEDWMEKNKPAIGGYLVEYEDGYRSYSPAKAFEDGYKLVPEVGSK